MYIVWLIVVGYVVIKNVVGYISPGPDPGPNFLSWGWVIHESNQARMTG